MAVSNAPASFGNQKFALQYGKGDIIFWKNFEFSDDTAKDSYIVLLTEVREGQYLYIRGTTNTALYNTPWGRKRETFVITPEKCPALPRETILDFGFIKALQEKKLIESLGTKRSERIAKMPPQLTNQLVNNICAAKTVERNKKEWIKNSPLSIA
jgi:hypothetical protein